MPISAETPELLIAQVHDALQGMTPADGLVDLHIEKPLSSPQEREELTENMRRRTGRVKRGGGAVHFQESQQFRTHPDGTVLAHGALSGWNASRSLGTRLNLMKLLQTNTPTPAVQGDVHYERVAQAAASPSFTRERFDALVQEYQSLPVNEDISDVVVRRLCAAMGDCGIASKESCEGHGDHLPCIWFTCPKQRLKTLTSALKHLRENWIVTRAGHSRIDPSEPLYVLEPKDRFCEKSKATERYPRAIQDLDTLGLMLLLRKKK